MDWLLEVIYEFFESGIKSLFKRSCDTAKNPRAKTRSRVVGIIIFSLLFAIAISIISAIAYANWNQHRFNAVSLALIALGSLLIAYVIRLLIGSKKR